LLFLSVDTLLPCVLWAFFFLLISGNLLPAPALPPCSSRLLPRAFFFFPWFPASPVIPSSPLHHIEVVPVFRPSLCQTALYLKSGFFPRSLRSRPGTHTPPTPPSRHNGTKFSPPPDPLPRAGDSCNRTLTHPASFSLVDSQQFSCPVTGPLNSPRVQS